MPMSDYSHIKLNGRVSYYSPRRSWRIIDFLYCVPQAKSNEESHVESNLKDLFFSMAFDK